LTHSRNVYLHELNADKSTQTLHTQAMHTVSHFV